MAVEVATVATRYPRGTATMAKATPATLPATLPVMSEAPAGLIAVGRPRAHNDQTQRDLADYVRACVEANAVGPEHGRQFIVPADSDAKTWTTRLRLACADNGRSARVKVLDNGPDSPATIVWAIVPKITRPRAAKEATE